MEIRFDKRLSNSYFFNASYTYSQLDGNYSGLASSDENGRSSPNVNRFFDLPFLGFTADGKPDNGRLATDRPHVFKLNGGYNFNWGRFGSTGANHSTDFNLFFTAQSGTPLSTRVSIFNAATFLNGRGDLGRTEAFTQTDFAVIHRLRLAEKYQVALEMNILNLFDEDNALTVFNTITPTDLSGDGFTGCGNCDELNTIRAIFNGGLRNQILDRLNRAPGAPGALSRDARFNQPNGFQSGRAIRFGLKFSF